MGKLVAIETYDRFTKLQEASGISDRSLTFILDTGQLYTHGLFFNVVSFGTSTNLYVPLNIAGTTKNLSLAGHTHSNYYAKDSDIDIGNNKIVSGQYDILKYINNSIYLGNSSNPTYFYGTLKTIKSNTEYTILDTSNFSVESKTITGFILLNVATIKYGNTNYLIDYVKRLNVINTLDNLATHTNMGTTNENNIPYGFLTMYTDGELQNPKYALLRVNINTGALEVRSSGSTTWKSASTDTWKPATTSLEGYVPILALNATNTITTQASEYVLTYKSGTETAPVWRKLPTNAFNDHTYTGYDIIFLNNAGTTVDTFKSLTSPNKTLKAGSNVTISAANNVITIQSAYPSVFVKSGSTAAAGLVPKPDTTAGTGKFLCEDGTWKTPTYTSDTNTWREIKVNGTQKRSTAITSGDLDFINGSNTTVEWTAENKLKINSTWIAWKGATNSANGTAGYMPAPTSALRGQFLRGDGSWVSLNNYSLPKSTTSALGGIIVSNVLTTAVTLTSANGSTANRYYGVLLDKDGKAFVNIPWIWNAFTAATANAAGTAGYIQAPAGAQGKYFRGDNTWQTIEQNVTTSIYFGASNGTGNAQVSPTPYLILKEGSSYTRYKLEGAGGITVSSDASGNLKFTGTTYSVFGGASSSADGSAGLVKKPVAGDQGKFLRGDCTWQPISLNVTSALYVGASNGTSTAAQTAGNVHLIFVEGSTYTRYKITGSGRASVTSDANGVITINSNGYNNFTAATSSAAGSAGLVPGPGANILGSGGYFLRADGSWAVPTNTWKAANTAQEGYVPKLATGGGTIATQSTEYVLTFVSGGSGTIAPVWKLLPANAFNNTWTANALNTAGYVAAPTKAANANMTWLTDANGNPAWRASNNHSHSYLPLGGGTMTGNILFSGDNNITWSRNTDYAKIHFKNTGDGDSDSYLGFETADNGNEYFRFGHTSGTYTEWMSIKSDGVRVKGTLVSLSGHKHAYTDLTGSGTTANQAIVSTGTANGWTLKTLGSNAFNSTSYLPLTGGTITNGANWASIAFERTGIGSGNVGGIDGNGLYFYHSDGTNSLNMYLKANDGLRIGGNLALTAGNYSSYALPLSGGTMTGNISMNNSSSITNLPINGGIYWNPYVESASDGTDAASIRVVTRGVAGGTTLIISQQNDSNDTIQFVTNGSANLYHNSNKIWDAGNDGSGSGLDADMVDGLHFKWSNDSDSPTYLWAANSSGTAFLASRANLSVNYSNYAGYLSDFTRVSRVSKNSSNEEIETVSGWQTSGFVLIQRFCPPTMYYTTGDMPAPYGIGFGNGSESGGIIPIGLGDKLEEIRFYGANSGPTIFTFGRQLWDGANKDSRNTNHYATYLSINGTNGNLSTSGTIVATGNITAPTFIGTLSGNGRGHSLGYRHLDAGPKSSWSDSRLYIGYNGPGNDDGVTDSIGFYRSTGTGTYTRTLWAEINSNGLYANTRFGVNGQSTGYNFYVNGTSYLNGEATVHGNLNVGAAATSNYIQFYGLTGDNPVQNSAHYYIGNRHWADGESSEMLIFSGNDIGNGNSATSVSGAGPDRFRVIAGAHLFLTYTSALSGTFETVATSSALKNIFEINTNNISSYVPFISTVTTGTAPILVSSTTVCGNLNADLLDGCHESAFFRVRDGVDSNSNADNISLLGGFLNATGNGSGNSNYPESYSDFFDFPIYYHTLFSCRTNFYWRTLISNPAGTDWRTLLDSYNYSSYALPLSGGTMTGNLEFYTATNHIEFKASTYYAGATTEHMSIGYGRILSWGNLYINANTDNSGTEYIILTSGKGVSSSIADGLAIGTSTLTWLNNNIWHAGNDGSGSGLDADLLDGVHATEFLRNKLSEGAINHFGQHVSFGGSMTKMPEIHGYKVVNTPSNTRISNLGFDGYTIWTVSGYFKADSAVTIYVDLCDRSPDTAYGEGGSVALTTDYVYHKFTFTNANQYNTSSTYNGFFDISGGTAGVYVYVKDLMIEKGYVAHEWRPSITELLTGTYASGTWGINVAWSNISSKPTALGSATLPVYWNGSGFTQANAYPTKSSWNYDDVYLKLSGGTLTGPLVIHSSIYGNFEEGIRITRAADNWAGITFGSTGASGAPTNGWFVATNPSNQFIIEPDDAASTNGLCLNKNGDLYWRNNVVIHSGNISSYASGGGSSNTTSDFFLINSSGTPSLRFHVPNANWANICMKSNGEFYFYETFDNGNNNWAVINCGPVYIYGVTSNAMGTYTSNPKVVFAERENGSTYLRVALAYTDFDSYRSGKGLKVLDFDGDDPNVWFEVGGNCYAYNFYVTSDITKKTNISTLSEHIRKFTLRSTGKEAYGVIAQEVPEMFREGKPGDLTVNYSSILSYYVGLLENKVKELELKVFYLELRLNS